MFSVCCAAAVAPGVHKKAVLSYGPRLGCELWFALVAEQGAMADAAGTETSGDTQQAPGEAPTLAGGATKLEIRHGSGNGSQEAIGAPMQELDGAAPVTATGLGSGLLRGEMLGGEALLGRLIRAVRKSPGSRNQVLEVVVITPVVAATHLTQQRQIGDSPRRPRKTILGRQQKGLALWTMMLDLRLRRQQHLSPVAKTLSLSTTGQAPCGSTRDV